MVDSLGILDESDTSSPSVHLRRRDSVVWRLHRVQHNLLVNPALRTQTCLRTYGRPTNRHHPSTTNRYGSMISSTQRFHLEFSMPTFILSYQPLFDSATCVVSLDLCTLRTISGQVITIGCIPRVPVLVFAKSPSSACQSVSCKYPFTCRRTEVRTTRSRRSQHHLLSFLLKRNYGWWHER
jgi:hypothetical protein